MQITITASGTEDIGGDEFPSTHMTSHRASMSPLAADIPGADTSSWSSAPRPHITAYRGADMDAYFFDNYVWVHCQTGKEWNEQE